MVSLFKRFTFLFAAIAVKEICCSGKQCLSGDISSEQCPQNQTCVPTDVNRNEGRCDCSPGFVKITNDLCLITVNARTGATILRDSAIDNKVGSDGGSAVLISTVSCLFIIFVICVVYFNYRHRFLNRLWLKMHQRRGNYDEVMIGQAIDDDDDDPPLA